MVSLFYTNSVKNSGGKITMDNALTFGGKSPSTKLQLYSLKELFGHLTGRLLSEERNVSLHLQDNCLRLGGHKKRKLFLIHRQSTPLPDKDQQNSGRNVAINTYRYPIMRQTTTTNTFQDKKKPVYLYNGSASLALSLTAVALPLL